MNNPIFSNTEKNLEIAIIGSGISGLCMAINLKKAGITTFKIFEKADNVGGTWHDNTYPGCGCDTASILYSFSFEPKSDWTRNYPKQPEILQYLEHCADKYDIRKHITFNTEITGAFFESEKNIWRICTASGEEYYANILVSGCGQLNQPKIPNIDGLETFSGTQFHSARWNHEHDLKDETVAVIGTGASAIQFIPIIAQQVKKLIVFQRTAAWVLPKLDFKFTSFIHWLGKTFPLTLRLYRWLLYLVHEFLVIYLTIKQNNIVGKMISALLDFQRDRVIKNENLKSILKPNYAIGCKRVLISNDYYHALQLPNVEVVADGIKRINQNQIITKNSGEYSVDTLIFATGFDTTLLSAIKIVGLNNQLLQDKWQDGAEAYKGIMIPGFPNLFMLYGPNTNTGTQSIIFMIECQVNYILSCIKMMQKNSQKYLDVKSDINSEYNEKIQVAAGQTVWNSGCSSWYKTKTGKIVNNWPFSTVRYWLTTFQANPKDFNFS
ncbi:NAD(P)/FAD-dependent oxidoreductase [Okeania sp.]|uniref:flavin-containing monooxygenase n=1 Tax=Okeania sp. TaxID=3100323 RepID=UPI002B4B2FD4|nr:NAD(P)/FAD-dependent oxidoreductase [Okeania sp.]MEB3340711.1 NAD(P)/FAD-dependent oxidoreductase [Okeania sp.]